MVPLKIVSNVSRFKPALNLNRVLADLNRGSNSLNSISGFLIMQILNVNIIIFLRGFSSQFSREYIRKHYAISAFARKQVFNRQNNQTGVGQMLSY